MEHEGTPVPVEPTEAPTTDTPPTEAPTTEPVQPVHDEELETLEQEGAADVNEMSPEVATADDTVDNEENDQGGSPVGGE